MSMTNTPKKADQELYLRVRGAFVGQGGTPNAWCRANGVHIQNVREAFFGTWRGPRAEALVERVLSVIPPESKGLQK